MAISTTASAEASSVICGPDKNPLVKTSRSEPAKRHLHPVKLHSHPYTEICLAISGRAIFELENNRYPLRPPSLAVIHPGVIHCEGYSQKNHKYSVLWLSCSGQALLAAISNYQPGTGWNCPQRWSLRSGSVQKFFNDFNNFATSDETTGPESFEALRANMLAILGQLYQQAFNDSTSNPTRGKHNPHRYESVLKSLRIFIDNHLDKPLSLHDLAGLTRISPNYLNSLFTRWMGKPIHGYLVRRRMEKAMRLLRNGDLLIKQVAGKVGYDDPLYFSRAFHKYYGYQPSRTHPRPTD